MFKTPYETTVGRMMKMDKTVHAIRVALVEEVLHTDLYPGVPNLYGIVKQDPTTDHIPPFNHPITVEGKTVVDLRSVSGRIYDRQTDVVRLDLTGTTGLLIKQAVLQTIWERGAEDRFSTLGDFPIMVFSHWVSESIAKRLAVDHATLSELVTLSAWFYICQTIEAGKYGVSEDELIRQATRITRIGYRNFEETYERIRAAGYLSSLDMLVDACKALGTSRLAALNTGVVLTILSGSWFGGASAKTMVGIAVEYPPYFLGMLHTSITEKAYKNTTITTVALRFNKRDTIQRFDSALKALITTATE